METNLQSCSKGAPISPHGVIEPFYKAPADRAGTVKQLFDRSAHFYDRISGFFSMGSDRRYRKMALQRAGLKVGMKMLDVATGTGLVVRAALQLGLDSKDIVGLDPSQGMLEENRKNNPIQLIQGYGEHIPFPDESFDFISMGYALRHVEDLRVLFEEFRRVLKPGGKVLIMEISRPRSKVAYLLMRLYMGKAVPAITRLFTGNRDAARLMEYYWATIAECVPPETIVSALEGSGFKDVGRTNLVGVLNDYVGVK